jgi:hypothetical protein
MPTRVAAISHFNLHSFGIADLEASTSEIVYAPRFDETGLPTSRFTCVPRRVAYTLRRKAIPPSPFRTYVRCYIHVAIGLLLLAIG